MNIVTWIQNNWVSLVAALYAIETFLGAIATATGNKDVMGIDTMLGNFLKTFVPPTPPKS